MKPQKTKNKALELYISNVPIYKISKQLHTDKTTIIRWRKDNKWDEIKKEAIQNSVKNTTNELINLQTELGRLASEELLEKLKDKQLKNPELVSIAKHGLEVVRPRTVQNNLNITKNEQNNNAYQIIIPKEVEELLKEVQ